MKRRLIFPLLLLLFNFSELVGQNAYQSYQVLKEMENASVFKALPWKQLGPSFQGGRVETIDSPLGQPNVIYTGFGAGSLWKSTDQGLSWKNVFAHQPTFSIGDLAISPSNPDILYLGTGESHRATRGFSFRGAGIFRSSDGGNSWISIGLHDTHHIGRVVVHPNDPNIVFVAAIGNFWSPNPERGLYMTRDGGKTWKKSLFISDSAGVVDVAWDHVNKIIYAASWEMTQGKKSGIFRSTDQGVTWEKCRNGFPEDDGIGRIGLAISPTEPNIVYASVDNRNPRSRQSGSEIIGLEIYRSEDSGKTWQKSNTGFLDEYSGYGWAFGDIRVSPEDANSVYVLGVHALHSKNGGKSFTRFGGKVSHILPSRAASLHLDQYELFIDPENPERLVLGNGGGIYQSFDHGIHWLHSNTIPVAEVYDLTVGGRERNTICIGTQDNASICGKIGVGKDEPACDEWSYIWLDPWSGGDGFITIPDPTDPSSIYYEMQNGSLNRKNLITGQTEFIQPKTEPGESPMRNYWLSPFFVSEHSPESLYYAANRVYKSINRGDSWYRLSPDLCYPEDQFRKSRVITALAESQVNPGLLYAGTDKGALWASRDDGINWIEISEGLPYRPVAQVYPSRHLESRVYAIFKSSDDDEYEPYLYVSENKGSTWIPISGGVPEERINCLLEDPQLPDLIFIGTDQGVFASPDRGRIWTAISKQLTTASVQKLAWVAEEEYLVAATHGQSLFFCQASAIRKYYKSVDPVSEAFLAQQPGYLPGSLDFPGDLDWIRHRPGSVSWYQPRGGAMILSIADSSDKEILSARYAASAGLNYWEWDLLLDKKGDESLYPLPQYKFPARGTYNISIQGQGMVVRTTMEVR